MPQNALAPTPVNALDLAVQQQFGLQPNMDRLSVLPRYNRQTGWVAPNMLYQAARGLVAPYTSMQADLSPEEALNVAMMATGGSFSASSPANALRAGFSRPTTSVKVFHGGASPVTAPDLSRSGFVSGIVEEGPAFWVTPSKSSAESFGRLASNTPIISEFNFRPKNPLIVEYPVKTIIDGSFSKLKIDALNKARQAGHDSVVFKQAGKGEKLVEDEIAILNPAALKK